MSGGKELGAVEKVPGAPRETEEVVFRAPTPEAIKHLSHEESTQGSSQRRDGLTKENQLGNNRGERKKGERANVEVMIGSWNQEQ